jgi:hypothetical protein
MISESIFIKCHPICAVSLLKKPLARIRLTEAIWGNGVSVSAGVGIIG